MTNPTANFITEFDRLIDRAFGGALVADRARPVPGFEIRESGDAWHLRADLPGFARENVTLAVEDGMLRLTGEVKDEARSFERKVDRTLRLPEEVDPAGIDARLENGVLEVTLPKVAPAVPETLRIEVK